MQESAAVHCAQPTGTVAAQREAQLIEAEATRPGWMGT
jgi:hypothetical protein